jgi:integrase
VTGLEPGSQEDLATVWRLHIGPELGDIRVGDIDTSRVLAFRELLKGKKEIKKASTRNKIIRHLKTALRFAADRKIVLHADLPRVKEEKVPKVKKPVYREEDIDAMLDAGKAIDTEHEVYIYLLVDGALRIGELNALHWADIDLRNGTMEIQRTEWKHKAKDCPKGHVGTVPLTPELKDA